MKTLTEDEILSQFENKGRDYKNHKQYISIRLYYHYEDGEKDTIELCKHLEEKGFECGLDIRHFTNIPKKAFMEDYAEQGIVVGIPLFEKAEKTAEKAFMILFKTIASQEMGMELGFFSSGNGVKKLPHHTFDVFSKNAAKKPEYSYLAEIKMYNSTIEGLKAKSKNGDGK